MEFVPPLQAATLVRRYQRFFADVITADGRLLTIHCPNTGKMTGCAEPGFRVWYQPSSNPKRKLAATWELAANGAGEQIIVNTQRANQLVAEALASGRIAGLKGEVQAEVKVGESRLDFALGERSAPHTFIEVKSVTLHAGDGLGLFPDTVTSRGRKHLELLANLARSGRRAVLLLVVGHSAIDRVAPAITIDPAYGAAWKAAHDAGVEFIAWRAAISPATLALEAAVTICHPTTGVAPPKGR